MGEGGGMVSVCVELEQGTLNEETITVDFSVSADCASSSKADPTSVPVRLICAIVSLTATLYLLSLPLPLSLLTDCYTLLALPLSLQVTLVCQSQYLSHWDQWLPLAQHSV